MGEGRILLDGSEMMGLKTSCCWLRDTGFHARHSLLAVTGRPDRTKRATSHTAHRESWVLSAVIEGYTAARCRMGWRDGGGGNLLPVNGREGIWHNTADATSQETP
jgi:hypothetical protein